MDNTFLLKHLEQAHAELQQLMTRHNELEDEQRQLEHKMAKLTQDLAQLHELCGEIPNATSPSKLSANVKEWGLSDAIRVVMRAADRALSATDIRDRLKSMGFDVKQYQNDMATVNLTLERLRRQGEIDATRKKVNGKRLYIWSPIGPNISEIVIVNPPYSKPNQKRYRVNPNLLKVMLTNKRTSRKK